MKYYLLVESATIAPLNDNVQINAFRANTQSASMFFDMLNALIRCALVWASTSYCIKPHISKTNLAENGVSMK